MIHQITYISQIAVGKLEQLIIFGNDYETIDRTGVRDFIHVVDLAKGHVAALNYLVEESRNQSFLLINLGKGTSVLQLVTAFSKIIGKDGPYVFVDRRTGDIDSCYASAILASELLG